MDIINKRVHKPACYRVLDMKVNQVFTVKGGVYGRAGGVYRVIDKTYIRTQKIPVQRGCQVFCVNDSTVQYLDPHINVDPREAELHIIS